MPKLFSSIEYKLYILSEEQDEHGQHQLIPLDVDTTETDIDESEVEDTLMDLFGHDCFDFTDNMTGYDSLTIDIDDKEFIEIHDIIAVDVYPKYSRFYIVIKADRSMYNWVVAVPHRTCYYG